MKRTIIIISIIITIVILAIVGKMVIDYINDKVEPIVYYSYNDSSNLALSEDNKVFSNNLTIVWYQECSGVIKKDGQVFSKKNGALLTKEGTYEITVKSPSGKNKETKILRIDKTPPEVKIVPDFSGNYTIIFEDVNDVDKAILLKIDKETKQLISQTDLLENGLQESIEIKEKGYYILNVFDKLGNSTEDLEFTIE